MYDSIEIIFKTGDQIKARQEIQRRDDFDTTFEYVAKELERIHRVLMNQKAVLPDQVED